MLSGLGGRAHPHRRGFFIFNTKNKKNMSTVKGQNLRLTIGGLCVAAARSCTVHIQMTAQDSSTKDTEGDWQEQSVVNMAWDATVESLYFPPTPRNDMTKVPTGLLDVTGFNYRTWDSIHLKAGDTITVEHMAPVPLMPYGIMDASNRDQLARSTPPATSVTYTATEDIDVYPCAEGRDVPLKITTTDSQTSKSAAQLEEIMESRQPVDVTLSVTTGDRNREESEVLLSGSAVVSDFAFTAANKEDIIATVKLTGVGELEIPDE
jgi:predicted secreted protein